MMRDCVKLMFLLAVTVVAFGAQLTNIAGSSSVTLYPANATCGVTSTSSFCRVDREDHYMCNTQICGRFCQDHYGYCIVILNDVSGFTDDGSVTKTTGNFTGTNFVVATFNKKTPTSYLRGTIRMRSDFTLSFWIRPSDMRWESYVIDIIGADERVLSVILSNDLHLTVMSGSTTITDTLIILRHSWTHVLVQGSTYGISIYLNGSYAAGNNLALNTADDMSKLTATVGQPFADRLQGQFLGQLADIRLYDYKLRRTQIHDVSCALFAPNNMHPFKYAIDSDLSTFWLTRNWIESVDIIFDLHRIYQLEEISATFVGRAPLNMVFYTKVNKDDTWQLLHEYHNGNGNCVNTMKCTSYWGDLYDGYEMKYNVSKHFGVPHQRQASTLRVHLSGYRSDGKTTTNYYGFYNFSITVFSICGPLQYLQHTLDTSCFLCYCDVRGVIDGDVDCTMIGGQCACKQYVTGRRCDVCLPGYDNLQQNNVDGCSKILPETTTSVDQNTSPVSDNFHNSSPAPDNLIEATTVFNRQTSPAAEGSTKSSFAPDRSSTSWLLYTIPVYIVIVAVIVVIITVICVKSRRRRRRRQQRDSHNENQPAYVRSTPVVLSDACPDYTLMTRPGSDKIKRHLAGKSREKSAVAEPDYPSASSEADDTPVYQRPVPAVPVEVTPTYTGLKMRQDEETEKKSQQLQPAGKTHGKQAKAEPDDEEALKGTVNNPDYQRPVPAVPVKTTPVYASLKTR